MPDESDCVPWRPRSPLQLTPWQTSSKCTPSQSSPLTFIRDSVNVKPASDCFPICSVIHSLSLFKHSRTLSQSQGFSSLMHSHVCMQDLFFSATSIYLFPLSQLMNEFPWRNTNLYLPSLSSSFLCSLQLFIRCSSWLLYRRQTVE